MNYEKIGQFILKCRKEKNLTQKQLAEQIGVTDKAVSKWERGLGCPDVSILGELAASLDIGIGELLNGEKDERLKDNSEFIKQAVLFSKVSTQNNIYNKISNIIIIFISIVTLYLIFMNFIQIEYLNKKTEYYLDNSDVYEIKAICDSIENNIQKIKNDNIKIKHEDFYFNKSIIANTEYYLELVKARVFGDKKNLTTPEIINEEGENYNYFNYYLIHILKNISNKEYDLLKIIENYGSIINNYNDSSNVYSDGINFFYIDLYRYSSINYNKFNKDTFIKNIIYNLDIYDYLLELIIKEVELND